MIEHFKTTITAQFEASLCMLGECIDKCPEASWDDPIGKYPFWHVAYHTLCYVDVYLSPSNEAWQPQTGLRGLHPNGRAELEEEYPSRRFNKPELVDYLALGRRKAVEAIGAETPESLAGPSGFQHLPFSRAELHLYNLRHIQHHTGQLSAFLRRHGVETRWVKSGWR